MPNEKEVVHVGETKKSAEPQIPAHADSEQGLNREHGEKQKQAVHVEEGAEKEKLAPTLPLQR